MTFLFSVVHYAQCAVGAQCAVVFNRPMCACFSVTCNVMIARYCNASDDVAYETRLLSIRALSTVP
jgi:hypothetical protein